MNQSSNPRIGLTISASTVPNAEQWMRAVVKSMARAGMNELVREVKIDSSWPSVSSGEARTSWWNIGRGISC
ncbi:hypothetical protein [Arcanobacterium haemolyticum]|uniref:hypothetical protein n=1 Tax=Arcanobacterium haemolyticum TaxID=28264 RepID=UPI000DE5C182|nr:hypothetical protein [Arcanobacterium haemolyticum]